VPSWSEARDRCQSLGGDLATITTPEEMEMLHYLIGRRPNPSFALVGLGKPMSTDQMYRLSLDVTPDESLFGPIRNAET
jgi:hypothetical protein